MTSEDGFQRSLNGFDLVLGSRVGEERRRQTWHLLLASTVA
jgi:hypothetical protein